MTLALFIHHTPFETTYILCQMPELKNAPLAHGVPDAASVVSTRISDLISLAQIRFH